MKRITFAGESLVTGDAIADALVHFAEALARGKTSAAIEIPVRLPDGNVQPANFLLGPSSQMVSVPEASEFDELIDDELVARLDRDAALLGDPRPQGDDTTSDRSFDDLDYV